MLRVQGLCKSYAAKPAVADLSFEVGAGEVVALLGPNGAGKTTTMRMIAGVLEPDAGIVTVAAHSMWGQRLKAQSALGYLPEGAPLTGEMTARAHLEFLAAARGIAKSAAAAMMAEAAARASIEEVIDQRIETLSKGFRRRVALACAILHDPPVLVLDEPTDGLDPNQKRAARALIGAMSPGRAILISTHMLDEVEAMCGRAIVMADGRILADTTPAALAGMTPGGRLEDAFAALTEAGA